jgi:hypothetical protein
MLIWLNVPLVQESPTELTIASKLYKEYIKFVFPLRIHAVLPLGATQGVSVEEYYICGRN